MAFSCTVEASTMTTEYLTFLNLGSYTTLARGKNTQSNAIYPTETLWFGSFMKETVYVSTNGYFSIGNALSSLSSLSKFTHNTGYSVVAPFAADISTLTSGFVRYNTFTTGDFNINTVSSFIRSEIKVSFYGTWMVVAEWYNVPLYSGSVLTTNRFQGVIITDGSVSYAVFLYNCPSMMWSGNAIIGWQASRSYYRNHPLSSTSNAKQIACLNMENSESTVLFKLNSVKACISSSNFGCFDGGCVHAKCDGESYCPDNSDELSCSYDKCERNEMKCDNKNCVPNQSKCDGNNDCGDNSDENRCVNVRLAVGLSFGLFILICFICIPIIICISFCYTRRNQRIPPINASSKTALTSNQNICTSTKVITNTGLVYPKPSYKALIPLVPQPSTGYAPVMDPDKC